MDDFLPGLLADTEMAQRSNRRFLNLISVEVFQAVTLIRKRAGGIHHGQESLTPPKAEYIGADRIAILFSLAILLQFAKLGRRDIVEV